MISDKYTSKTFCDVARGYLQAAEKAQDLDSVRKNLDSRVSRIERSSYRKNVSDNVGLNATVRDCARVFRGMLKANSDQRSHFSISEVFWDLARGRDRPELTLGFFAEMIHMMRGVAGDIKPSIFEDSAPSILQIDDGMRRSDVLDSLWSKMDAMMNIYTDGLSAESAGRRAHRRRHIITMLGATEDDFYSWQWQIEHLITNESQLAKLVTVENTESEAIRLTCEARIPFAITPYYASLMDDDPGNHRDRAIRAQVIPSLEYIQSIPKTQELRAGFCDFMKERSTSPVPLVTRRYPAIAILKPFNSCPQICVYCQRNWEIDEAMSVSAMASRDQLETAFDYIESHEAISEVLVTGGDPFALPDDVILGILKRIASIQHVRLIRIGTRTPVTLPMRITSNLVAGLGRLRVPGTREICIMTHIQHPYEITPELALAVDLLKRHGISVYNQLVYTFFISRRFEAARLRMLVRSIGIDPYYTFMPKGKVETAMFRVPLARLLQEQKEEARLLTGLCRTDEAVYNVPVLGKNYIRAFQHRDLLTILPDGSRLYDYHPWEKGIVPQHSFAAPDTPIYDYLSRLEAIGENPDNYASIWHYY